MPASLTSQHPLRSAAGLAHSSLSTVFYTLSDLQAQHSLLCSMSLFVENRLSLPITAIPFLVITLLSLDIQRTFALLVLCRLWAWCLPHYLQNIQRVLGTFTILVREQYWHRVFKHPPEISQDGPPSSELLLMNTLIFQAPAEQSTEISWPF